MGKNCITAGGQPEVSDKAAARALAQGHSKSGNIQAAWGMKDQTSAGDKLARRGA